MSRKAGDWMQARAVKTVAPESALTPLDREIFRSKHEPHALKQRSPGRFGKLPDIRQAASHLSSDAAVTVMDSVLRVDRDGTTGTPEPAAFPGKS